MTCIFCLSTETFYEPFALFLFIVSIYLIQGQIFKVPLIENYQSDLYEIYRGNAAGYKESTYQISNQSKKFYKSNNFLYLMPCMHPIPLL